MGAIEKIEKQQKGKESLPEWMIGEQLKEICRREPESGKLVEKDIDKITLEMVAAKLKEKADALHAVKKESCVCISPMVAEQIIREAYGLPGATKADEEKRKEDSDFLDLDDFL